MPSQYVPFKGTQAALAALPSTGKSGVLAYTTDTQELYADTGSGTGIPAAWKLIGGADNVGVIQILAGTGVTISPTGGTGEVTITATPTTSLPASALTGTTLASNVTISSLTTLAGGTVGSAAYTSASAYDVAGAAATAQSNAESFATSAANTAQSNAQTFATSAVTTERTRAEAAEALLAPLTSPTFTGTLYVGDETSSTLGVFGQTYNSTNPLQLLIASNISTNVMSLQSIKQGYAYETLALNPSGGAVTVPTPTAGTNNTQAASTAFVSTATSTLAPLSSPVFTGNPTTPTATAGTNTTQIASTAFVTSAVATETTRAIAAEALKAPLASPTFTGTVTVGGPVDATYLQIGNESSAQLAVFGQQTSTQPFQLLVSSNMSTLTFSLQSIKQGYGYETLALNPSGGTVTVGSGGLSVSGTITGTTKNFTIPYPGDSTKLLVHSSLEGPEIAVFYRGQAQLIGGVATITLPDYFEVLTLPTGRSVQLTPLFTAASQAISHLAASLVAGGQFSVMATDSNNPTQDFYWEVKAVRSDVPALVVVAPIPPLLSIS